MNGGRAKTLWTILLAGSIAVLLPFTLLRIIRREMAPMITRDNAGITFNEFQAAIQQGNSIHDAATASDVAGQVYQNKTGQVLIDGWGKPMHIYALLHGTTCDLNIQSAGSDGNFGDGDDLTMQKTFDLTPGPGRIAPHHQ